MTPATGTQLFPLRVISTLSLVPYFTSKHCGIYSTTYDKILVFFLSYLATVILGVNYSVRGSYVHLYLFSPIMVSDVS